MPSSTSARLRATPGQGAQGDARDGAEQRHQDGLPADDGPHLPSRASDGAQQPELARPLDDREDQRVHDAEHGDDNGEEEQRRHDAEQLVDRVLSLLGDVFGAVDSDVRVVGEGRFDVGLALRQGPRRGRC